MKRDANLSQGRRSFLKRAVATAAAPWFVPAGAMGQDGGVAPSNRVTMGHIGLGMMGRGHLAGMVQYPEVQILAACDPDQWRREDAKNTVERTYAAKRPSGTYRGCRAYTDLGELLARDDIDAVVISTGDNWHATAATLAAKAGKDIYCEKPASKTIRESRAMIEAVQRYGRVFQTGLQQRSAYEFIKASALVRGGAIGKVKMVYVAFPGTNSEVNLPPQPTPEGLDWNQWLGPAPERPFHARYHTYGRPPRVVPWDFCRDLGGGNLTSNAVHSFDVVQWALGMDGSGPVEITPPETGLVPSLTYKYADGVILQVVNWKLEPDKHFVPEGWDVATRLEAFGALYVGQDGWIHVGRRGFLKSYPEEILDQPTPGVEPGQTAPNHHKNWLECIRTRQSTACGAEIGCVSTIVSHLGCIAHWTGRTLHWDPVREEFAHDKQANLLRSRPMRPPWQV